MSSSSKSLSEKLKFIQKVFGSYELARNELNCGVICPFCNKRTDKKKFVIKLDDYRNHCWVCGRASRSLIFPLKRFAPQYLNEFINDFYVGDKTNINLSQDVEQQNICKLPDDAKLLTMIDSTDRRYFAAMKYLIKRDISLDDMWYYKFLLSNEHRWERRIIVPSFDAMGKLNHFVARGLSNKVFPKYDMPDTKLTSIVFNELYVDWKKRLVLCEGAFDAMKCGDNVVPLLGSDLNEESLLFERIVVNNTPIALALDEDMFHTKTPKLVKKLEQYNIDVVVVKVVNDPGSMSKQQFCDALNIAQPLSWFDNTNNRLQRMIKISLKL